MMGSGRSKRFCKSPLRIFQSTEIHAHGLNPHENFSFFGHWPLDLFEAHYSGSP